MEAMQMGARMHRKIQSGMGASYHAEVPLKLKTGYGDEDITVTIEGRADGIMDPQKRADGMSTPVLIDEIKGVFLNPEHLSGPVPVHLAQAKVYALIYALKERGHEGIPDCPKPEGYDSLPGTDVKPDGHAGLPGTDMKPDGYAGLPGTDMKTDGAGNTSCRDADIFNVSELMGDVPCTMDDLYCGDISDRIAVRMTYVNLETEEIRYFHYLYNVEELREWFLSLMKAYYPWAKFRSVWRQLRNESAGQVQFPFPYREGQRDVAAAVYRTIEREKQLFIMAPTGVGKTIATVFPSVKAVGEEKAERIFYLTAKTITRTVAQKAFASLQEQGLRMKVLTLTAKDKICFCEERRCNPDACPYAEGHFDRVNAAVYALLTGEDSCGREIIERYAREYRVCPFEMALDLSLWVDAVICDYNYLFDPNAHLRRFFSEGVQGRYIFLIDEAHNLVERGRKMYSASLLKEDFLQIRRRIGQKDRTLAGKISACNRVLLTLKREGGEHRVLDSVSGLIPPLLGLMGALEEFLEDCDDETLREELLDFYFKIRDFLSVYELADDNYVIYSQLTDEGFMVKLFCVNPAKNLQTYLEKGVSTVFFSATFLPIRYYKRLLSVRTDDYAIYAESPFSHENRCVLTGNGVSTKYTLRSEQMYERYARFILKGAGARTGNYMAFFPSYRMLEDVLEAFRGLSEAGDTELLVQEPGMTEADREAFLEAFAEPAVTHSRIGFCVMGGIFAEGIDLTEDSLIGAFIIGTGLPQVSYERELLKQYFDERGGNGFDYAYLYSGMNRVLQAAGRVIRTETDRGVVLLLDDRFGRREYRGMFPREWDRVESVSMERLEERLSDFWTQTDA